MSTLRRLVATPLPRSVAPGGIGRHRYEAHPCSGAGNCWCGRAEDHALHQAAGRG